MMLLRYFDSRSSMFRQASSSTLPMAVLLGPLLSMVIFPGWPCRSMARSRDRLAVAMSRLAVEKRFLCCPPCRLRGPGISAGQRWQYLQCPPVPGGVIDKDAPLLCRLRQKDENLIGKPPTSGRTLTSLPVGSAGVERRLRKCLGFKTPHEVFIKQLQSD